MSNGKGDTYRPTDYRKFAANYDEINWDDQIRCINCNLVIDKTNLEKYPTLYIQYEDGAVEHRECNFN